MISTKKNSLPSASKRFFSASVVKPVIAASTILLIDRFYFKNNDLRSNLPLLIFGKFIFFIFF